STLDTLERCHLGTGVSRWYDSAIPVQPNDRIRTRVFPASEKGNVYHGPGSGGMLPCCHDCNCRNVLLGSIYRWPRVDVRQISLALPDVPTFPRAWRHTDPTRAAGAHGRTGLIPLLPIFGK